MPVILPDSEAVERWLDPNVKEIEALKHIKQISKDQVRHDVYSHTTNYQTFGHE